MSTPFINRQKASSHTMPPGGLYVGVVKSVLRDGTVNVFIPRLGINYGPLRIAGQSAVSIIQPNQQVVCAFLNSGVTEVVVISTLDKSPIVVSGEFDTSPGPTDVYVTPINDHKIMKFAAAFAIDVSGSEATSYIEFVINFGIGGPGYGILAQAGSTMPFGGITMGNRVENGNLYITCSTGNSPVRVRITRLLAL